MFEQLIVEAIRKIVIEELTKHKLDVAELSAVVGTCNAAVYELNKRFDDFTTNVNTALEQNSEALYTTANELRLHTQAEQASTQTRTDEELTEFIVSAVRNECDIEEFIDERIERALDNSEFIKHDALEDALNNMFDSATIEIRF